MPGGFVCSGTMKAALGSGNPVREALAGKRPLRKLFSKEQRALLAAYAPDGLTIDDLGVLGPIFVLKLKLVPKALRRRLVAEMWLYPDNSTLLELSTRACPARRSTSPRRRAASSSSAAWTSAASSRRRPARRSRCSAEAPRSTTARLRPPGGRGILHIG